MPPIGDTLREARMRQKLDIADIEERTKIRAKYLRALENEEWGVLPGPTFVRTFLRTYAEVVGVDPHLLVEEYRTQHEPAEEPDLQPLATSQAGRDRRRPRTPGPPGRWVVLAAMAVALVAFFLVLGLVGGNGDKSGSSGGGTTEAKQTQPAKRPPAKRKRRRRAVPAPTGVTVRIAPTVPTYACLDTGDGSDRIFEGTIDGPKTFRNPKELRVNLGKRSVSLRANGKAVTIQQSPEPFGLRVTTRGAKEITQGTRPCA